MADSIKGRDYEKYTGELKIGILLHRFIDSYTDSHPVFKQSTKKLHQNYGHYSGVIVDMYYDHFLCKNWAEYSDEKLCDYVTNFYESLHQNHDLLTDKIKYLLPYMEKGNWLYNYQFLDAFEIILTQMDSRTKNKSKMRFAVTELKEHYTEFEAEFTLFFEDIRREVQLKLADLRKEIL